MADDFVLYNYDLDSAVVCNTIEDVFNFGQKIGFNKPTCDELVEKTYLVDLGKDYEVDGKKFVVWDDSFGGYHQYHASAKKSTKSKSQPTFTDMVNKQRNKNIKKRVTDNDREWMRQRCEGVMQDYYVFRNKIIEAVNEFIDEAEDINGESFLAYLQSYEFIDVDETIEDVVKQVKRQLGL